MEIRSISKPAKVFIAGLIVLSIISLSVVNVYLLRGMKESEYKHENEVLSNLFHESKNIWEEVFELQNGLKTLRELQQDAIDYSYGEDKIINHMVYNDTFDLTTFNDESIISGSVVIKGKHSRLSIFELKELNAMESIFELEKVLVDFSEYEYTYSYFSNSGFIAQFPKQDFNNEYYKGFDQNVDEVRMLIDSLNSLPEDDFEFIVNNGIQSIVINHNANAEDYLFTLPIERNKKIIALLQLKVSSDDLFDLSEVYKYDKYYLDDDNIILASSNHKGINTSFINYAKESYQGLHFYENKFPLEYELRSENDYKLYVVNNLISNGKLVYVEKLSDIDRLSSIVINNLLLLFVIAGLIYLVVINDNRRGNRLEVFIKKSRYDGMTELYNHNSIIEEFSVIHDNNRVKSVSVLMLDIDNFKKVNDAYGHSKGDQVIRICAENLRRITNKVNGVAGRYGGEEFIAYFPRLNQDKAYTLAEEIRKSFNHMCIEQEGIDITISIGLYYYEKPSRMDAKEVIIQADKNLYKAKRTGKNKVVKNELIKI